MADAEWHHGKAGANRDWAPPLLAAVCGEEARPGYDAFDASEYMDHPSVLREKVALLAEMWRRSRQCVVYTGAGISTAAGIGDYASRADKSVAPHRREIGKTVNRLELQPTKAHRGLAALERRGHIGNWLQQNHDRLAQKAGFPQSKLNEIHGAWGDNKNCVKMMDDSLREDLLRWLLQWSEQADLCVAMGTSLCGMTSDTVADATAERHPACGEGLVIVGLQRTRMDNAASLRIWCLCDTVIELVCKELGVKVSCTQCTKQGDEWVRQHPRLMYNTPTRRASDPI